LRHVICNGGPPETFGHVAVGMEISNSLN